MKRAEEKGGKPVLKFLKAGKQIVRDVWYKSDTPCVLCGEGSMPLCRSCISDCLHPELGRCLTCGKLINPDKTLCSDCQDGCGPQYLKQVVTWGHYSGNLKTFIQNFKFGSAPLRVKDLGRPLADWACRQLPPADGILAVPMHAERLAERGFNQADVIASILHWELGLPVLHGVIRQNFTQPQVGLSRRERLSNLRDAFVLQNAAVFRGRNVWIIDDVTTTGATLEAVAEVLHNGGAKAIYGLCLAGGAEKVLVPSQD